MFLYFVESMLTKFSIYWKAQTCSKNGFNEDCIVWNVMVPYVQLKEVFSDFFHFLWQHVARILTKSNIRNGFINLGHLQIDQVSEIINYVTAHWHVSINIYCLYQLYFSILCINVWIKYLLYYIQNLFLM